MKVDLDCISIMSELGAGTRGSSLGLAAMKVADWKRQGSFFKDHEFQQVETDNDFIYQPQKTPSALNIEGIAKLFPKVRSRVKSSLENGKFPFIVSGDHSTAAACIQGFKAYHANKRVGVIWIDAHADLHSPYTSPSGNVHGMPLAIASHEFNLESAIRDIKEITLELWNEVIQEKPAIQAKDISFAAVRDTEPPEDHLMKKHGIQNQTVAKTRELGVIQTAKNMLDALDECDVIYLSFDVDSMDSNLVSVGTGTPVPNGYSPQEAIDLILELLKSPKIGAFELVEVNPCLDNRGNVMAETALTVLEHVSTALRN